MKKITVSPVTRISGLLSVEVTIDDSNLIVEANCSGEQFRGFEAIMTGRKGTDATYLTQRICGICSMAHGYTAAHLISKIYGVKLSPEVSKLQQAMLSAEYLQNHIRHFYLLALPDYLSNRNSKMPGTALKHDCRFTPDQEELLVSHYFESMDISRKCHEMLAIFGGKIPHQHGLVSEGVTVIPTADRKLQFLSLLEPIQYFIHQTMLPDVYLLADTYRDYFSIGVRPQLYISFGLFDPQYGPSFPAGIVDGENLLPVNPGEIEESIRYSWFRQAGAEVLPAPEKPLAYTWIKAARYQGLPLEGGPLARKAIKSGKPLNFIPNTMDRLLARAEEAALIADWLSPWVSELPPDGQYIFPLEKEKVSQSIQLNDAPRGALLHGMEVNEGNITNYTIITPTGWNFSPKDQFNRQGPVEEALVGSSIADREHPVEIGRIIRAFDPCISCGAHVVDPHKREVMKVVIQS